MRPRIVRAACRNAVMHMIAAAILAASTVNALADAAQIAGTPTERNPIVNQATALPPMVRVILAEALAREEDMKRRGLLQDALVFASFPLPICLFEHGLCGAVNRDGSIAVPPQFDFVDEFHEGRALVRSQGLYGYVDAEGKVVVEPRYPIAGRYRLGLAEVDIEGKSALIDLEGKQVLAPRFSGAVPFAKGAIWVNENERNFGVQPRGAEVFPNVPFRNTGNAFRNEAKWGLIDSNGAWIRRPEFRDIAGFDPDNDNLMWAQTGTGWGLIRPDGTWQLEPTIRYKHELSDDRAEVWRGEKSGYIDRNGAIAIPFKFEIDAGFTGFKDGMPAAAKLGGRLGLIDRAGNWVVEPAYDSISNYGGKPGTPQFTGFVVSRRGKYGLLDPSGNIVIAPALEPYKDPGAGRVRYNANGSVTFTLSGYLFPMLCPDGRIIGLIDQKPWFFARNGDALILSEGEIAWPPTCDTPIVVKVADQFSYVDSTLKPISNLKFEVAGRFRAGFAAAKLDGKFGLIRANGSWAVEPKFDAAGPLEGNLALAKLADRAGVLDVGTGAWVTQESFDGACSLGRGIVGVMRDGKMGAIDGNGGWLLAPLYDRVSFNFFQDFSPVRSHGKWGYVDAAGNTIAAEFDQASQFERGAAWVKSNGDWCAIDRRGDKIATLQCQATEPRYLRFPPPEVNPPCQITP
jgi:hypothetical protein